MKYLSLKKIQEMLYSQKNISKQETNLSLYMCAYSKCIYAYKLEKCKEGHCLGYRVHHEIRLNFPKVSPTTVKKYICELH